MPRDESLFPVDQRIFLQTLFGNREPITEADFSQRELDNIVAAVQRNQKRTGATTKGNVGYDDYPSGDEIQPGYAPIESTLGRFNYRMSPLSELQATDRYDFWNDERKANVERYENMPAWKRNVKAPLTSLGYLLSLKPRSAAGELGDAFIGREGREVKIKIPTKKAKGGAVHMGIGGLLKLKNAVKGAQKVLPAAERDANLAKFLEPSKIPQRLYHGTGDDIKEFRNSRIGAMGPGVYLAESPKNASEYSIITNRKGSANQPNVMPVYLQTKNPFVISDVNNSSEELFKHFDPTGKLSDDEVIRKVLDAGYDSIYAKATGEINVLDPRRIKSAISNRGTYDITDPDISKAKGGGVHFDEGGAAFGVFPQMKARRAQQDRPAAANAPLSALRGWAAGTAGLPGDIEGLARAGISQLPPQLLTAFPALRAFGIGSRADPTPQLPTTEFYNEYLPGAQLNATPTGKAFTVAGNLLGGAGSTTLARYGIKSAKAAGQALGPTAVRIGEKYLERQGLMPGVIKDPGGNFLKGDIEDSVRPMKIQPPAISGEIIDDIAGTQLFDDYRKFYDAGNSNVSLRQWTEQNHPEVYKQLIGKQGTALNTFIDKKIAPYIRNEMATPDDPLRAMAEKYAVDKPVKLAEVQARIDAFAAKMEQTARDRGVPVGDLTSMRQQMIGLEKEKALVEAREGLHFTPDEERYRFSPVVANRQKAGTSPGGMGRSPLARSWENVTDAALTVDTASKWLNYKGKYPETALTLNSENPWLAKVPPETKLYSPSATLIERAGFDHLVDELRNATNPESGLPKNLLIDPADLGKLTMSQAVDRVADINAWRATQKIEANQLLANNAATQVVKEYPEQGLKWVELKTPKDAVSTDDGFGNMSTPGYDELEAALKYEGDTMQHCVGGYCPDVIEGRSRIYSLRDSKGQPRVTIEVKSHEGWFTKADGMPDPSGKNRSFHQLIDNERSELARQKGGFGYIGESYEDIANRLADQYGLKADPSIAQIKGFKNKKPADEYLPMVQDFVKSGNWSDVRDLRNAGLHDARVAGKAMEGRPAFMTDEEWAELVLKKPLSKPEGMAQGGLVSNHFDPIKIKQIIAGLDDEYDPENIQQIIAQRESAYA